MKAVFHVIAFPDDGTCRQVLLNREQLDALGTFLMQLCPDIILLSEEIFELELVTDE